VRNRKKRLAIVLGIRPDVIRASIILDILHSNTDFDIQFIWSGQHYSDNLKEIFFRQLNVRRPSIELNAKGETDSEIVSSAIHALCPVLREMRPVAAVFLGDNNTVLSCVAAAQMNVPIVHIEGCMRSYDWRMPEEKYRIVVDHLSDVIYAYLDEYKRQGIAEGLNPGSILVTGNPIVDVLQKYYFGRVEYYRSMAEDRFFASRHIIKNEYYLMTCHRRENVEDIAPLKSILNLVGSTERTVYFPASYRTQRVMKENSIVVPKNVITVDPVGYEEFLLLMTNSRGVFSDSGTVVEEACILNIPCVQMRTSTERPQVYDVGACVKFDPARPEAYPAERIIAKLEALRGRTWCNPLGDGKSSERIATDLLQRLDEDLFAHHRPNDCHLDIKHSFTEDGLDYLIKDIGREKSTNASPFSRVVD
jgi:UDP-N-acetylglucosamine 2-epimerase (non-hydrolysing)